MRRRSRAGGEPVKARRRKTLALKSGNAPKAVRHSSSSASGPEAEVVRLTRELVEARELQAATAEVLRVISISPGWRKRRKRRDSCRRRWWGPHLEDHSDRGPRHRCDGPIGGAAPLADHPRTTLPRASRVTGPGERSRGVRGTAPGRPLRLDCEGRVVRTEPRDGRLGVAVAVSRCR